MSRMAIPTMDVVRFKEADVIVASFKRSALVQNFGIGSTTDAQVTFLNGRPISATIGELKEEITSDRTSVFYRDMLFVDGDDQITLGDLVDGDDADGVYTSWNGTYLPENGAWHKQ